MYKPFDVKQWAEKRLNDFLYDIEEGRSAIDESAYQRSFGRVSLLRELIYFLKEDEKQRKLEEEIASFKSRHRYLGVTIEDPPSFAVDQ